MTYISADTVTRKEVDQPVRGESESWFIPTIVVPAFLRVSRTSGTRPAGKHCAEPSFKPASPHWYRPGQSAERIEREVMQRLSSVLNETKVIKDKKQPRFDRNC